MKALLVAALSMAIGAAHARETRVEGTAGYLSEWEFSGDVREAGVAGRQRFSGKLTWKDVGLCSANGPEEKSGDITLQISRSGSAPQIHATLWLEGAQCTYSGAFSETSAGLMDCSDATGIPVKLKIEDR